VPLDPTISLGAKVPDSVANDNPLGTISNFANIQNQLNQNRMFQQTFAARKRAGEIISSAPDADTAVKNLQADQSVSAFYPEILNNMRQFEQTTADIGRLHAETAKASADTLGTLQKTAFDGLHAALGFGIPAVVNDPSEATWKATIDPILANMSPAARATNAAILDSVKHSILDGLPDDPVERKKTASRRAGAIGLGSGVTPEVLAAETGVTSNVQQGNQITPTTKLSPLFGGGETPSGPAFGVGSPAGFHDVGGVPVAAPGLPGNVSGSTNALGATPPGAAPASSGASAGSSAGSPVPLGVAGNGELLVLPPDAKSPSSGTNPMGMQVLNPTQRKNADELMTEFSGSGLRAYQNANSTLGSLVSMSADLDTMAKGGGFLSPGSGAQFRADVAKAFNTMADMAGMKERMDPDKIAAVDAFNKETNRMGLTVLTTMLGNQREAAQTINSITTRAVPGIDNSYMGGKLVIEGLKATTQRAIDQRKWENAWQAKNQGNLNGAAEAFNSAYPAESYAHAVLDKFGIGPKGFRSPQAIVDAVAAGYMTPAQGKALGIKQFGGK
jgi:hypothetical protein